MVKKVILFLTILIISINAFGQKTILDETGNAYLRNSSSSSNHWTGTTNLVLGATAVQNTGFRLSYEADSNPRVGRLSLNNNWGGVYGDLAISLRNRSGTHERFRINNENGNVGIGTSVPDSKLSVNGKIHTKEVKVDIDNWSDFVFMDGYYLSTLEEVENHIREKGHLKDIPSAEEVCEKGIYLGEMDSKLLQKIEELTLYIIEQDKKIKNLIKQKSKIENLQKENVFLTTKFLELQKRIEKLEKK